MRCVAFINSDSQVKKLGRMGYEIQSRFRVRYRREVHTNTTKVCTDNLPVKCFQVWQAHAVAEGGQSVSPNHGVELGLRLLLCGGL